jgi:hypothetical protein
MDMRESFSRLEKKLKHPLTKSKRKLDRTKAEASRERVHPIDSLPRPGPHDREGSRVNAVGRQTPSTDRSPQSDDEENVERVHPSPPTPSLVHGGKPESMRTPQFCLLPLIILQATYRRFFPTRVSNRALPRMRRNRIGSPLCLPRPNYSSAG